MKSTSRYTSVLLALFCGFALLLGMLWPLWQPAHADPSVLYAAPSANGSGDCSDWANACILQTALASAASSDQIWVKMGVYIPGTSRADTFALVNGVEVYGGFAGSETQLDQRDWVANPTVLSGDIAGDNCYHVVTASGGVTDSARLDGFTITAGQASSGSFPNNMGGGMYNDNGSPTLANLVFSGNTAGNSGGGMYNRTGSSPTLTDVTFSGNTADFGGGMFSRDGSSPTLTNVTFTSNTADSGGGIYNSNSSPALTGVTFNGNTASSGHGGGMINESSSSPTLTDVTFSSNTASSGYGGGMFNNINSSPALIDVSFSNNTAANGGGMYNNASSSPSLTGVTFSDNTATSFGGGMYNYSSSSPALTDVTFHGNSAANGGGMFNYINSSPVLTDVIFRGNSASGGGGMYNHESSSPLLTNVIFSGNTATWGGGMSNDSGSSPILTAVTFSRNTASTGAGGMYNYNSNPTLNNVILWGDSAPTGPEISNSGSNPTIAYSAVQGSGGSGAGWNSALGTDGGGNIDADPLFVDADGPDNTLGTADDNLRLQLTSPAIDAGDNGAIPIGVTTDLDDNPRFVDIPTVPDTGNGTPPIVDMGAYEFQWFADVTLTKDVHPGTVAPGEAITFTLSLASSGSRTATQVVLTDTLPTFLAVSSVTSSGILIDDTGYSPAYVWNVQDLAPGEGGVITITGRLNSPLAAGVYTNNAIVAFATDSGTVSHPASVTYTVSNLAPTITSTPVTTATQGVPYTYTVISQDMNGDAAAITAPTLPGWLTLTGHGNGTATLSGTPTGADVGNNAVTLLATDPGGLAASQTFTITVWSRVYVPLVFNTRP